MIYTIDIILQINENFYLQQLSDECKNGFSLTDLNIFSKQEDEGWNFRQTEEDR